MLPFFLRTIWMANRSNRMTLSSASAVSRYDLVWLTVTTHLVKPEAPACQLLQHRVEPSSGQGTGLQKLVYSVLS